MDEHLPSSSARQLSRSDVREDAEGSRSPFRASSRSSDFDVSSYLDVGQAGFAGVDNVGASTSSSFSMLPHSPVERSMKRRGSSRSNSTSSSRFEDVAVAGPSTVQGQHPDEDEDGWQQVMPRIGLHDGLSTTAWHSNHRRGQSSASNADIGLRGIHSRHASSVAGSPLFLQTSSTSHGHERPYSQASFGSETDLGGRFDDATYDDEDITGPSDRVPLTPRQNRRNWQRFQGDLHPNPPEGLPNSSRLYDSPVPPDVDQDGDEPDQKYPEDLESSPETIKQSAFRKSRRAKGTEAHYRQSDADLARKPTLSESAKKGLKRMSMRVVNFRQRDEARHVRMQEPAPGQLEDQAEPEDGHFAALQQAAPLPQNSEDLDMQPSALRGRTLGVFGPHNWLRKAAHRIFMWS